MPYVVPIVMAVAAAGTAAMQAAAAAKQAALATSVAQFNAKVDISNAQQLQLDAAANIRQARAENEAYRSKIRVAYAASGILSDSGSPMQVLATTAGRQEQDVQNYWRNINQKSDKYYGAAAEGIREGEAQADLYHLKAASAVVQGIGSMASAFGGMGGGGVKDLDTSTGTQWTGGNSGAGYKGYV